MAELAADPGPEVRLAVSQRHGLTEEQRAVIDYTDDPGRLFRPLDWVIDACDDESIMRRCATSAPPALRRSAAHCPHPPAEFRRQTDTPRLVRSGRPAGSLVAFLRYFRRRLQKQRRTTREGTLLFRREVLEGIASGRIDRVFRVWAEPRVRAGSTQRTWAGIIVIDSVTAVTPEEITEEDALRSGFEDRAALLTALSKSTKEGGFHRVMLHLGGPDPRSELAGNADLTDQELADLKAALDTIDTRTRRAPWTREVLRLIEEHPGLRALDLAEHLGRDKLPFKADVRRLKALGLTESLETGYRLSPRGKALMAYLRSLTE